MRLHSLTAAALVTTMLVAGCDDSNKTIGEPVLPNKNPFPSTYQVPASSALLIQGANLLTGTNQQLDNTDLDPSAEA